MRWNVSNTDMTRYSNTVTYSQRLAELLARAIIQFEGCKVTWQHARIYLEEMEAIPCEDKEAFEEAKAHLRSLVTEK